MSSKTVTKYKQQATQSGGFFVVWLGHSSLRSSLCEQSDAELGSHSPLVDRQARLSGEERANHGAKRSYPSARPIFRKALQSPRFYDILITERRWGYEKGLQLLGYTS